MNDNREMSDDVRLVDLELIKRYSLALRQEWAPADEVLAVLEASRQQILATMKPAGQRPARRRRNPAPRP